MNIVLMNFGFLVGQKLVYNLLHRLNCYCQQVFGVTDYVDKMTTLHYGACVAKTPRNPSDKEVCRVLGLRLAECKYLAMAACSDVCSLTSIFRGRCLRRWPVRPTPAQDYQAAGRPRDGNLRR